MSTAVALKEQSWTPEQMHLITNVIAKGATPDELKLFLFRCQALDLDPFKPGQIHFVKYGTGPGTIVVGIEGFRTKAARTGMVSGVSRGVIKDEKGKCIGAWAEVHRKDWSYPAREEVALDEFTTGRGPWSKMPEAMIKKCAEAAALRMAFPDDLGGVYTDGELDKEEEAAKTAGPAHILPEAPGAGDGVIAEGYRCPATYVHPEIRSKMIKDCEPELLRLSVVGIEKFYKEKSKPIPRVAAEFIEHAEKLIAEHENNVNYGDDVT